MIPIFPNESSQRVRYLTLILSELGYKNVKDFQISKGLAPDGIAGINTYNALYKEYLNVEYVNFEGHYTKVAFIKKQIVLHHSAGWDNARGMFDWWKADGLNHVATAVGITDDGKVTKGYDEAFWAVHIGAYDIGLPNFYELEQNSVGVEICNWGALREMYGKYYTWAGQILPESKVIRLDYKTARYYEVYTDAEIETTRKWIMLNAIRFNIPIKYSDADLWQVSQNAIQGKTGLYTHNSFISWKTDISPQPKMVQMLKNVASV